MPRPINTVRAKYKINSINSLKNNKILYNKLEKEIKSYYENIRKKIFNQIWLDKVREFQKEREVLNDKNQEFKDWFIYSRYSDYYINNLINSDIVNSARKLYESYGLSIGEVQFLSIIQYHNILMDSYYPFSIQLSKDVNIYKILFNYNEFYFTTKPNSPGNYMNIIKKLKDKKIIEEESKKDYYRKIYINRYKFTDTFSYFLMKDRYCSSLTNYEMFEWVGLVLYYQASGKITELSEKIEKYRSKEMLLEVRINKPKYNPELEIKKRIDKYKRNPKGPYKYFKKRYRETKDPHDDPKGYLLNYEQQLRDEIKEYGEVKI